jgi:hypothetical protein
MTMKKLLLLALFSAGFAGLASRAEAQTNYRGSSDNTNGPTVSPYLNLLQNNSVGNITNYQSLVKPLIEQNSAINRQGNSINRLQQQVNSPSSAGTSGRGTGHTTFFMNYGHFYPAPQSRR